MPDAQSARSCPRALRAAALAIAAMAVLLVCAVAMPQRAYAYSTDSRGAVGKVTGAKYGRTYYGTSVADVMHIVDDMTSSYNNKLHEYEVTIELMDDWNTKSYGRIKVPNGYTYHINLNGHMINRDRALNFGKDKKWYADGSGEVIYVDGGTLYLEGGTGAYSKAAHAGYTDDNGKFWKYDGKGKTVIKGGLITGGACDDWHGAGGISLASSSSRAYIKNVTIAGNITDQVDSSRYGHGAGIAVHASGCTLELDNVKVDYNHAEGYGGGIYFREAPSRLVFTDSEICNNTGIKGGGGIYFDSKIDLTIENVKINDNVTHASGGGIYFNDSDSKLTIKGTEKNRLSVSGNSAKKCGGAIYSGGSSAVLDVSYTDIKGNSAEGGGFYINGNKSKLTVTNCGVSENSPEADGGGFYIDGNECTVVVKDSNVSDNYISQHNGGAMYHNGKKGSVTFENTTLSGNEASEQKGGLVYSKYDGTTFTIKDSTISGSKAAMGGAFYLEDVTTLILDNATIKECDGNGFGEAGGGAVYTIDNGTRIEMRNNAKIVECRALTEGDGGATAEGGAIYSSGTTTITSPDGTGVISGCVAKIDTDEPSGYGGHGGNGGGIWFKGELYLDNITITGNSAETDPNNYSNGYGGGVYCANDSYKAFEVARTVKITGNTAERVDDATKKMMTVDSNLYLCGSSGQELCSASGDRALTADSRIGVEAGMGSATRRRVTGNQAALTNIKDCYGTVFTSDDKSYGIALDGNYVYLSSDLPSYTVSVKTGCYSKAWSAKFGSEIKLYTDEWLTYKDENDEAHEMNEYRYGSVNNKVDYWTVTDSYGTRTVVPEQTQDERQVASFTLRGSDATAVPHVVRPVGAVGLKITDAAGWDSLVEGSASVSLTYTNIRDVAYSVPDSDVWEPVDWEKIYMLVKDTRADKLDSITTDAATLASGTEVKRAKVEDVTTKDGVVTGKKVTYEVTLKKSLLGDDLYSRTKQLVAFQAQVNNSELGDQVVEDQTDSYRSVTYRSKLCSVTANDAGDMTVSFSVTYPAVRTVTFDTGDGAFADGSKAVSLHTRPGGTLASLPSEVPTREGYAFDGWYVANEQGEPSDTAVTTSTVFGSDTTVVAKWRATTKYRMVLYMSQEGDGADAPSIVDVDLAVFDGEAVTAEIEKPATDPTREGYTFGGWYTDAACTAGSEFFNGEGKGTVTYADTDLCLYAKWTPETYSVTFDADGGAPVPSEQSVTYGNKVTVPETAPTKTGYTFRYWALDGVSEAYDFDTPVTGNIALKAVWEKNSYTVEYKSGDTTVAKTKVADGEKAPSMDPGENEGYRFDGWFKDSACTEAYDFDTPVTSDLTFYAKWVKACTVTFDTPEDAEQVDALTVDAGTKLSSADLPRPVRDNYRFHGWLLDGTGVDDEITVNSDMTLESHWVGRTIFVYLLDNDDADYKMLKYGDALTEESLEVKEGKRYPTREGFTFKGWYTDDECTQPVEYGSILTDDLYLYPKWEAQPCTVSFNSQGGSAVASQALSYADCATEPEAPTRAGYVFKGWYTDEKCTDVWNFDDPVTKDMTLYAKWADTVTITLDANGGVQTDPSAITIERGTAVGVLPVPRRESSDPYGTPSADDGYIFAGWYTEDGKKVDAETEFSESTTLTAYWERNGEVCFVAYYSNGEMLDYDVVKTGEKVARPVDPTRAGYEFTGWYTDEDCSKAYDFDSAVTEDLKLYAGWKESSDGGDHGDDSDADDDSGKGDSDKDDSGKDDSGKDDKGRKNVLPGTGDTFAAAVAVALAAGCALTAAGVATKRRRN